MEIVPVLVYYDFSSTFCYVTHVVAERVKTRLDDLGIELIWQPIDLTEMTPWTRGDSFTDEVRSYVMRTALEVGVSARMPDAWMDSRFASGVALGLEPELERRWRCAIWEIAFEQQVPLDDSRVLTALARRLGIVWPATPEELLQRVTLNTTAARLSGVVGVPTFLLDGTPVGGVQDEGTMVEFLRHFAETYRREGSRIPVS